MTKKPLVAIGVINYNTYELTKKFLEQIKRIDYKNIEVFVLDNHSPNKDAALLSKIGGIKFIKNKKNQGYAGGANRIIEKVIKNKKYKYLLMINNDVILSDKLFLNKLVYESEKISNAGMVCPKILTPERKIQEGGSSIKEFLIYGKRQYVKTEENNFPKKGFYIESYTGCCALFKLEMLQKMNRYFEEDYFCYYEDFEICIKIKKLGYKIFVVPGSSLIHLEGFTARKIETDFARYYNNRNKFWTMRKYLNKYEFILGVLYYFFILFPKQILYVLIYSPKPIKSIMTYFKSIKDGLFINR